MSEVRVVYANGSTIDVSVSNTPTIEVSSPDVNIVQVTGVVGVSSGVSSTINGLSGDITIVGGDFITVDTGADTITLSATYDAGVTSINSLDGDVSLLAGDNITIDSGDDGVTISATFSIGISDITYTNADEMPEEVGAFPVGQTFDAMSLDDVLTGILYPYQDPTLSVAFSPNNTEYEVGYTIGDDIPGWTVSVAFTNRQNIQANSLNILIESNQSGVSQTVDTGNAIPSFGSFSEFYSFVGNQISLDFNKYLRFKATATNTLEEPVTGFSGLIRWKYKMYWGQSSNETLTQTQIKNLSNNDLITTTTGSYTFDEGTEETPLYVYLAFPDDGALPHPVSSGIKLNGLNFGIASITENSAYASVENGYSYDLVDVDNPYGQTISYRVYRSSNLIGTTIDLDITSS